MRFLSTKTSGERVSFVWLIRSWIRRCVSKWEVNARTVMPPITANGWRPLFHQKVFQVLLLLAWAVSGTTWSTCFVCGILERMQVVIPITLYSTGLMVWKDIRSAKIILWAKEALNVPSILPSLRLPIGTHPSVSWLEVTLKMLCLYVRLKIPPPL